MKGLRKCAYSKLVPEKEKFPGTELGEFYEFLRHKVAGLTDKDISDSLVDYLPSDEIPGLAMEFRAELAKLRC